MRLAGFSPPDLEAILASVLSVCHTENVEPVGELTAKVGRGVRHELIARWQLTLTEVQP